MAMQRSGDESGKMIEDVELSDNDNEVASKKSKKNVPQSKKRATAVEEEASIEDESGEEEEEAGDDDILAVVIASRASGNNRCAPCFIKEYLKPGKMNDELAATAKLTKDCSVCFVKANINLCKAIGLLNAQSSNKAGKKKKSKAKAAEV